ncbi:MAG: 2OG-Fe(II) oxygenase [Gammaproteobacteria bacterium]|nr:2OG-Fe(II) oxygenase [Gammaproteobacteria bacterium]
MNAVAAGSAKLAALDAGVLGAALDARGFACIPGLLAPAACVALAAQYDDEELFRSRIVMARHNFGRGEYRYFAYPLPAPIAALRAALYPPLAHIANAWAARLGHPRVYPPGLDGYLAECHQAGQCRPTPLLLRYQRGDYNCLHRDLYGAEVFPLQVAVLLSRPGADFSGGEFVLTEQRPRMQSRVSVVPLMQGDAVVFAVDQRPVRGTRGDYRVHLRHGVSEVTAGHRHVLGLIFHDAT